MDQVTTVRKHMKCEQWKSIITECRSSGMTVTAWCKANGICEQTYYRNLKKLRAEILESFPVPISAEKRLHSKNLKCTHLYQTHRQCFWHCKVYVRRYHSLREHLYRVRLYGYAKINRWSCGYRSTAVSSRSVFQYTVSLLWKKQKPNESTSLGRRWFCTSL